MLIDRVQLCVEVVGEQATKGRLAGQFGRGFLCFFQYCRFDVESVADTIVSQINTETFLTVCQSCNEDDLYD